MPLKWTNQVSINAFKLAKFDYGLKTLTNLKSYLSIQPKKFWWISALQILHFITSQFSKACLNINFSLVFLRKSVILLYYAMAWLLLMTVISCLVIRKMLTSLVGQPFVFFIDDDEYKGHSEAPFVFVYTETFHSKCDLYGKYKRKVSTFLHIYQHITKE